MTRRNSYMNAAQSALSTNALNVEAVSAEIVAFAQRMRTIPRKALRCEIYGTTHAVVDQAHAMNIFRKVFPGKATTITCYEALAALQDILDDRAAIPGA